jgi:hypothetical protein
MPTDFARLSPPDQKRELNKARATADWDAANGPLGGVIRHLRDRAVTTRRAARVFLGMLILTVILGLLFFLGQPLWQTWADGREKALTETIASIRVRKAEIEQDRVALLTNGVLRREAKVGALPDLLYDTLTPIDVEIGSSAVGATAFRDQLFVFGDAGEIYLLQADLKTGLQVPTATTAKLLGAASFADRLYFFGTTGTLARLATDGTTVDTVATGEDTILSGAAQLADTLYLLGREGRLWRLSKDGSTLENIPTGVEPTPSFAVRLEGAGGELAINVDELLSRAGGKLQGIVAFADQLYVFGRDGEILRLNADATGMERIPSETNSTLGFATVHADRLVFAGEKGVLLTLAPDSKTPIPVPTGTDETLNSLVTLGASLYATGDAGTLLKVRHDWSGVDLVPTEATADLTGGIALNDRLYVVGNNGVVLRLSEAGDALRRLPLGSPDTIAAATHVLKRLVVLTQSGTLHAIPTELVDMSRKLPTGSDAPSVEVVDAFLRTLPVHIRDWQPVSDRLTLLRILNAEYTGLVRIEADRKRARDSLTENPLQTLREQKALEFKDFLEACRTTSTSDQITTACLAAWSSEQSMAQRPWWQVLSDQLPPGILLLFLLANLGGLYRYNLRLAGFYESRADFLTLIAHGRTDKELRDILASTQGEAVNLATMVLAADNVEMGAIKAKLGQAEIELAKALKTSE